MFPISQFFIKSFTMLKIGIADTPGFGGGIELNASGLPRFLSPEAQNRTAAILTAVIHLLAFAALLIPPSWFYQAPDLSEVYTVDLFNVVEAPPPPPPVPIEIEPAKVKKVITKPAAVKTAPAKAVSVKPIVSKRQKEQVDDLIQKRLETLQSRVEEKEAREDARDAARDAVSKLRELYQRDKESSRAAEKYSTDTAQPQIPVNTGKVAKLTEAEKRYWAEVATHIQRFWTLPDLQNWEKNLTAVVVIKVRRDGGLINKFFERKSENFYFNQFVEKTLQESLPLPAFPPQLNEKEMEIGLKFHPAGLF